MKRGGKSGVQLVKLVRLLIPTALLVAASVGASATSAAAYGRAEQPLAQIELSANCNNPDYPLCQQVGLGGIWLWIEIDAGGSGDIAGAGCGHIRGVGGGAGPIVGDITWTKSTGVPPGAFAFGTDPTNTYYVVPLGPGEAFAFPVTVGHYSAIPAPAVAIQLQVAP
jgi:hypothetical protein